MGDGLRIALQVNNVMARHRLLLGAIALSIGFCLSLFFEQNLQAALLTGLITLPATLGAATVTDYLRGYRAQSALAILKARTHNMQRRGAKIYELLVAVNEERQRAIASLNSLQAQLKPLQNQVLERWEQSEELAWRVKNLSAQKQELETQTSILQTQIQAQEHQALELNQVLSKLLTEKQQAEAYVNPLKTSLRQLHDQVKESRSLRDQLTQEIKAIQGQRQQLETKVQQLQKQLQSLERQVSEAVPPPLQVASKQLKIQVASLRTELDQLETQILQRRTQKEVLEQQLKVLREQGQQPAASPQPKVINHKTGNGQQLPSPSTVIPQDLPDEWTEFMVQLPSHEFQVLKAIATQTNPTAMLRKIAEEQVTMPELLIDAINERAVDTVGDVVIEPGSVPMAIALEHQAVVQQVVAAYEYLTK